MELRFTDKDEIDYIKNLVEADVKIYERKLEKRGKVLSTILFAIERGNF